MKTAMVWGANGGIGHALLKKLKQEGWKTIAIARDAGSINGSADFAAEADVARVWDVENAVMQAAMEVETVDLWVYAVGDITAQPVEQLDDKDWSRIIDANLSGAYAAAHHSLPLMAADAHMVFLGAVSERLRLPGLSAYAAAKAGLEAFAEAFGKEQRRKRITVVRPGAVETGLWDKVPMRLPANAPGPDKIAAKILEAHINGHKGRLDLT